MCICLIVGGFYSEYCSPGGLASSRVRTSGGYHVWEEEDEGVVVVVVEEEEDEFFSLQRRPEEEHAYPAVIT